MDQLLAGIPSFPRQGLAAAGAVPGIAACHLPRSIGRALVEALDDYAKSHRFCKYLTPERTVFVRLREALVRLGSDHSLFTAITRQVDEGGMVVRWRIETVFGTARRPCVLRRMRWLELVKASLQVRLAATAYNPGRSTTLPVPTAA